MELVTPIVFGGVHGLVGISDQVFSLSGICWVQGNPDTARYMHDRQAQLKGTCQLMQDLAGGLLNMGLAVQLGEDHGELIPAEPGHRIRLAYTSADATGNLDQQLIAGIMAMAVVHFLEMVQVDKEKGQG